MTTRSRLRKTATASVALLGLGATTLAYGQTSNAGEDAGGWRGALTVGQSLRYEDNPNRVANPDDGRFLSRTTLGFSLDSATRTQTLRFGTGAFVEIDDDGDVDFSAPNGRLSYEIESANSQLRLNGSFRQFDVEENADLLVVDDNDDPLATLEEILGFTDIDATPVSRNVLIETGVRTDTDLGFDFETGLRRKVGLTFGASLRTRDYTDTIDPDLFDTQTISASSAAIFRIDPRITLRLTASGSVYEAEDDDNTQRTRLSYGLATTLLVNRTLTVSANVRQQRSETERDSGDTVVEGLSFGVDAVQDLPNGSLRASFSSSETSSGRRYTLRGTRAQNLANGGALSYTLGVTADEDSDLAPLVALSYSQPLKRGRFGVQFNQTVETDDEDDSDVIVSSLSASYAQPLTPTLSWRLRANANDINEIGASVGDRRQIGVNSSLNLAVNSLSSISAGFSFTDTEITEQDGTETQQRLGLQVGYRYALGQDWGMVARYEHSTTRSNTSADIQTNAISLGLEKTFSFRP